MKRIVIAVNKTENAKRYADNSYRCLISVKRALWNKGVSVETIYVEGRDFDAPLDKLKTKILKAVPSCVFNLFDGLDNSSLKEVEFAEILEMMDIPFTGSSSRALAMCRDKEMTKRILKGHNIGTPSGIFVKGLKDLCIDELNSPLFIKPCFEDASIGIDENTFLAKKDDVEKVVLQKLKEFPEGLIIEEFISGNEYHVGFLGNFPYEMLGISVNDYSKHPTLLPFLTYNSKWRTDSEEFKKLMPSMNESIPGSLKDEIAEITLKAGAILGCKGYFRVDLREKEGRLFILDVNPNPDISVGSGFMKQSYCAGYTYDDVIAKIFALAVVSEKGKSLCIY